MFAIFDLDGFKAYNDSFGHPAGDILLRRLGTALSAAVAPEGRAFRLGGDEFCILVPGGAERVEDVLAVAREALSEQGEGFRIGASIGAVVLPTEVDDPTAALGAADARMYAAKGTRSTSAQRQTHDVLVRILREREPELSQHLQGVAGLAAEIGRAAELDAESLDVVVRAAELHDIGKIAIPDRVLHKPGPLEAGRVGADADAHDDRRADPLGGAGDEPRGDPGPPQPRALGRRRLPGRDRARGDPARLADRVRLRRLRGDDRAALLPRPALARGGDRRAPPLRR